MRLVIQHTRSTLWAVTGSHQPSHFHYHPTLSTRKWFTTSSLARNEENKDASPSFARNEDSKDASPLSSASTSSAQDTSTVDSASKADPDHAPLHPHGLDFLSSLLSSPSSAPFSVDSFFDTKPSSSSSSSSAPETTHSSSSFFRESDSDSTESSSKSNPYQGIFSDDSSFSNTGSGWLSDQLDAISTPTSPRRRPFPKPASGRAAKNMVPRSVLFASLDKSNHSSEKSHPFPRGRNKKLDRSPLTESETLAFSELLNRAINPHLAESSSSSDPTHFQFGAYTSLINHKNKKDQNLKQLEGYARRNRILTDRFQETRAARARKHAREGIAAEITIDQLDAGVDEAREEIGMCENEFQVWQWAKKQVWGIGTGHEVPPTLTENGQLQDTIDTVTGTTATDDATATSKTTATPSSLPRFGKQTPFYAPVVQLLFVTLRDRYRSPHSALAVFNTTRLLGTESFVLGCTASLYVEALRTRWEWLSDLSGCRNLIHLARDSGVLADPISRIKELEKRKQQHNQALRFSSNNNNAAAASMITVAKTGIFKLTQSEDERIREMVDRIANDVRTVTIESIAKRSNQTRDQLLYTDQFDRFVDGSNNDHNNNGSDDMMKPDFQQSVALSMADELVTLSGPPAKVYLESTNQITTTQHHQHYSKNFRKSKFEVRP